jgi:hypothetical protein
MRQSRKRIIDLQTKNLRLENFRGEDFYLLNLLDSLNFYFVFEVLKLSSSFSATMSDVSSLVSSA